MITAQQKRNRKHLIKMLETLPEDKFSMAYFRKPTKNTPLNKKSFLKCGTVCCVSGWIAVEPYFQAQGIVPDYDGAAVIANDDKLYGSIKTFAKLFGLSIVTADNFIYGNFEYWNSSSDEITLPMAIEKIKEWPV